MARVKLSALFTAIRGKYGGGVFRDWNGRTTLAAQQSSLKNYYTEHQVKYRAVLGVCSKAWPLLSWKEKDAWEAVAVYLSEQWGNFENEVGTRSLIRVPRGPFTGIDALISVHSLLFTCHLWLLHQHVRPAPVGVTAPSAPKLTSAHDVGWYIYCLLTPSSSWGKNATPGRTRLFARSENGTFYTQFVRCRLPHINYADITGLRPEGGGDKMNLPSGVYHVQLDSINYEGLRSAPSEIRKVIFTKP